MRINKTNLNFASRNRTVRYADDIARKVNVAFPRVSPSAAGHFNNAHNFLSLGVKLGRKMDNITRIAWNNCITKEGYFQKIIGILEPIKRFKMGNCGEASQVAAVAAKINGIQDCRLASLYSKPKLGSGFIVELPVDLDHAVLYVENNGKPYVIDSWLGFADFVPNALERYVKEYAKRLNLGKLTPEDIMIKPDELDNPYCKLFAKNPSGDELEKLRRKYPELIIERK